MNSQEIREALDWYDDGGILDGPASVKVEDHLAALAGAARAYADLLDEWERIKVREAPKDWPMLLLAAVQAGESP